MFTGLSKWSGGFLTIMTRHAPAVVIRCRLHYHCELFIAAITYSHVSAVHELG